MLALAQVPSLMQVLAQEAPSVGPPPGATPAFSLVWYFVALVLLIVAGLVYLLTRRKERIEVISEKRADGLERLLATQGLELAQAKTVADKALEDLHDTASELKVVSGIKVQELAEFWAKKEAFEGELEALHSRCRALEGTLARWEKGEIGREHTS